MSLRYLHPPAVMKLRLTSQRRRRMLLTVTNRHLRAARDSFRLSISSSRRFASAARDDCPAWTNASSALPRATIDSCRTEGSPERRLNRGQRSSKLELNRRPSERCLFSTPFPCDGPEGKGSFRKFAYTRTALPLRCESPTEFELRLGPVRSARVIVVRLPV